MMILKSARGIVLQKSFPQDGSGKPDAFVEKPVDYAENLYFEWYIRLFSTKYAGNVKKCSKDKLWKTFL